MLLELATAAIIGISFGNAWTCIFMSFGTSTEERSIGRWFIIGRFLGLILLGGVISLLRFAAQDATTAILLVFGITTIAFGIFELIKYSTRSRTDEKSMRRYPSNRLVFSLLSLFVVLPGKGKCKGGTHKGRRECGRRRKLEKRSGFLLGVFRGATPCAKIIVLAPLLVAVGFPNSLMLIVVYASASTIYPVIGYLSADVLSNFKEHQFKLKIAGALVLVAIGIYTLFKVFTWSSIHT